MVINGSGSITGLSAGGLPDGTIQQADLATNVVGNGPAFSAYQNSSQGSITANVFTKIIFDTEEFDTNSNFASSRFTPTVAGYYQVNSSVRVDGSVSRIITSLYKNGSDFKRGNDVNGGAVNMNVSALVYANGSTDYFEIYALANGGTPIVNATGPLYIYFQASLVRAA